MTSETRSGEKVVSANALARAGSNHSHATANPSLFLGDTATALIRNSDVSVTLAVDKRASVTCAGIVTPRVDGLSICNQTDPCAARHVAVARATTRSKFGFFLFNTFV